MSPRGKGPERVGVDTGGTFTDFVMADGRVLKRPSSHDRAGAVLADGLSDLVEGAAASAGIEIVHGTTVGTNALLTDNVAQVGLMTTRGFADVLHLGRQARPDLFDLQPKRLWEAPNRRFIAEVHERMDACGTPLQAPDLERVRLDAERLVQRGAQAIAVCFLHSHRNPRHESAVARALRGIGVPVTISSDLTLEMREYERFSTAFANAALRPLMKDYVTRIARRMAAFAKDRHTDCKLSIMQSSGGLIGPTQAKVEPVRLVLSGPAGGGLAAMSCRGQRRSIMTLDMGGTSTDVCLLDGEVPTAASSIFGGRPLAVPIMDIHTVGAGGGSIARANTSSVLEVGPASAGAQPGPACYGAGGPVTVTDANLYLNRIPEGQFLGGAQALDATASSIAIRALAQSLEIRAEECALGVIAVAEAAMVRALRTISLERGHDPRRFSLMAFGGAGPLHAASLCDSMGMEEVLVPEAPGVFSAVGLLGARPSRELAACVLGQSIDSVASDPDRAFSSLERRLFSALRGDGVCAEDTVIERFVDMRYEGQGTAITLPLRRLGNGKRFAAAHLKRFGFELEDMPVELINLRARASGPLPPQRRRTARRKKRHSICLPNVEVGFGSGRQLTPVHRRVDLTVEDPVVGPAIIVEYSSTTLVPEGFAATLEKGGLLCLRREANGGSG